MFAGLTLQPATCADRVLKNVHEILQSENITFKLGQHWPKSKRHLRKTIRNKVGDFWPNVTITKTINLEGFKIPGVRSLEFSFVDPVYVWVKACERLTKRGYKLVWQPKEMKHPTSGEPVFGAGIQFGLLLRNAVKSVPEGGFVALMNLSWDSGATTMQSRSAIPICMQVMSKSKACVAHAHIRISHAPNKYRIRTF